MKSLLRVGLASILVAVALAFVSSQIYAEVDCSGLQGEPLYTCLGRQIGDLQHALDLSKAATTPLQSQVDSLDKQIKSIQGQITAAEKRMQDLSNSIDKREKDLAIQTLLLGEKSRQYYKMLRMRSPLVMLLSTAGAGQISRELGYQETVAQNNRSLIISLANEIGQLEQDKKDVSSSKARLASLQASLDKQATFFKGEIAKALDYQSSLTGQIAQLSALQQNILNQKNGTFSTTVGDVPLADDPASRPDYNPGFSPAFAAFSFGAPHFKGMSQYGAYGRAKSGQSADDILHAYYGGIQIKKDYDTGKQISVAGYGRMDIETYMKRIYEVPNSWGDNGGMEALKAQAVAARSYALAWTDEGRGGAICTTQACQVYKNSNKGGNWETAVNATRGWVLMNNGKPFKAWFASTSGGYQESYTDSYSGYTTPGFWDTPSGRNGWTSQAYEKTAESPWFYKGWYRSSSGNACNRSHPWLTAEEMADILNAWTVLKNTSDSRVSPLGGCAGGNPYSVGELRDRAGGFGGGYSRVDSVSVSYSDGGYTASVHFNTDKGGVDINGSEFKNAFNIRAPGWISLKSGLFNIEKK